MTRSVVTPRFDNVSCCVSGSSTRRTFCTRIAILLSGLLLLMLSPHAQADCKVISRSSTGTVAFTPPATKILPNELPAGTVLWESAQVTPTDPVSIWCFGSTNSGLVNSLSSQPGGTNHTEFPTNIPGLSYKILHPNTSNILPAYPDYPIDDTGFGYTSFTVESVLQLIVTDPAAFLASDNHTLSGGEIARWRVDGFSGEIIVEKFTTTGITFVPPSCSVTTPSQTVMLPTVTSGQFSGAGSTAGEKDFSIQLSCPAAAAGADVTITLNGNDPFDDQHAVINNSGSAQGVGVQVLDGNGNTIAFDTAISAGAANAGSFDIPLKARYYQTGASVSGGSVSATATYTITYQ